MAFMVQSSCIIFTSACSVLFLHRPLNALHIRGIAASMLGVVIVTFAGLIYTHDQVKHLHPHQELTDDLAWDSDDSAQHMVGASLTKSVHGKAKLLLGISLTLCAQLAQALQFITEEKLLQQSALHPIQVMGMEGMLATLLSIAAIFLATLLPGLDHGKWENWPDTIAQLRSSNALAWVCVVNFAAVTGTNFFGLRVSGARFHCKCIAQTALESNLRGCKAV